MRAAAALVFSAVLGCAGPFESAPPPGPLWDTEGLRAWPVADAPGALFVRPPRLGLSRYRAFLFDPPHLYFKPLSARPSRNQARRLGGRLRRLLRREIIGSFGWRETRAPGAGVVRVRASVADLDFSAPAAPRTSRATALVSPGGLIGFVLEFRDSRSGEVLLRYGVRRRLPGGTFTGPSWHELDRAHHVFRRFAEDARRNLGALRPPES